MHFYNDWALRILRGQWTDYRAFYGLPLYAYLLAGIYTLFGYTPYLPGFFQACLDAGTAVLLYKLATKIFGEPERRELTGEPITAIGKLFQYRGKAIGIMAAAGWAFFQPAESYSVILMPTACSVFAFWFVVWQIVKRSQAPGNAGLFLLGGLVGFSAMGIATILFIIPLLIGAILTRWKPISSTKNRWLAQTISIGLLFLGVGVGTTPAWIHNCFVAKDPVFLSAHGGVNFWIGNNPSANGYPKFPPGLHASQAGMLKDSINQVESLAGHQLKRSEISAYWADKAKDYIRANPWNWLKLLGRKTRNFWNAFQYDDLSIITTFRDQNVIFPGLGFGLVAALALPGLLLAWREFRLSRWIAIAIALQMLALLGVFVTERYRLPAVPGLLLFAGFGLWQLWCALLCTNYRQSFAYSACLIASVWLVSQPERDSSLWALDNYNTGLQALDSNQLDLAQRKLERAYAYVPENAEINFALGNLHLARADASGARKFYSASLYLDPKHTGALNNLGVLALKEERWDAASAYFRKAIEQEPDEANTHYLLAESLLRMGERDSARSEVGKAIVLKPNQSEFLKLREEIR